MSKQIKKSKVRNRIDELSKESKKALEEYRIELLFEEKYKVKSLKKMKMKKELMQELGI